MFHRFQPELSAEAITLTDNDNVNLSEYNVKPWKMWVTCDTPISGEKAKSAGLFSNIDQESKEL